MSAASAGSDAIWTEVFPTANAPEELAGLADAYDPSSDRLIVFGSTPTPFSYGNNNDVWVLENATGASGPQPAWSNTVPSGAPGSPQPRHGEGAVYDPVSNRLMMFGGCGGGCFPTLGDMWVLTNANGTEAAPPQWIQLFTTGPAPYPRNAPRLSYDPASNRMMLFSGQSGGGYGGDVFNDLWVLTNANGTGGTPEWIQLISSMPLMGQYYAGTAYDQENNRLIIFGGVDQTSSWTNGVWIVTNANGLGGPTELYNLIPNGSDPAPPAAYGSTLYFPDTNQLVFLTSGEEPWVLDNANGLGGAALWTQSAPSASAPADPRGPACCYDSDPPPDRVLLLEGTSMTHGWWMKFNQPPVADAGGPYTPSEGSPLTLDATGSSDPDSNIVTYEWDLDNDGEFDDATGQTTDVAYPDDGVHTVAMRVTDEYGEVDIDTVQITVANVPPTIETVEAPTDPMQVGTTIEATATFTDPGAGDTHTAIWAWGDDSTSEGVVTGTDVSGSHSYATPGVYTITLTVEDDDGGMATAAFEYVVIYDPAGGFVTGGGWIWSPPGAYVPDETLEGKATFGFVSKYKKGATTPTGNTEFQFHVADLEFESVSYDWLVIAGKKAKFKGTGIINGSGEYGFMLSATDGDPDMFRIKIWDKTNGDEVIYDNQLGDADDEDPTTELGGGSIVVHKAK